MIFRVYATFGLVEIMLYIILFIVEVYGIRVIFSIFLSVFGYIDLDRVIPWYIGRCFFLDFFIENFLSMVSM